jgi:hypothetical protein
VVTPATVIGAAVAPECVPVLVTPPLLDTHVAVWLVIALPLFAPIVNVTLRDPVAIAVEPETAFTAVGGAGEPTITGNDAAEARPTPRPLIAFTVHVYDLPVVTPVTVMGAGAASRWAPLFVTPPLLDTHVATWAVIALPLLAPIVNVTVNEPVAAVVEPDFATTFVGGAGEPTITGGEESDARPSPRLFVPVTVQV